jgi:hypothetical protein
MESNRSDARNRDAVLAGDGRSVPPDGTRRWVDAPGAAKDVER